MSNPWPALVLLAFALLPLAATAQDLPSRPMRIIVPNPPGGAGDISARVVGQKLSESLGQPVVVENQAGASGSIGMNMLKRAAPDGTTIGVVISLAQTIDLIQNKTASFDIVKDFTPITAIANNPAGLVVNSRIAAASLTAFIDLVRGRAGRNILCQRRHRHRASSLRAGPQQNRRHRDAVHTLQGRDAGAQRPVGRPRARRDRQPGGGIAAYPKRSAPAFDGVRYQALFEASERADHLRGGAALRAWTRLGRLSGAPRPAAAIAARLHREIVRILNLADVQQVLDDNGLEIIANTPADFARMIEHDASIWNAAAISAGLISR